MKNFNLKSLLFIVMIGVSCQVMAHFGSKGPFGSGKITCSVQGGGLVYLGTENSGVFVNTNANLVGWSCKPVGLKSGKISALEFAGTDLFAATLDSGVYRFTGYVGTDRYWEKVNTGLSVKTMSALVAVDGVSLIAATTNGKLFKTGDKGAHWTEITGLSFAGSKITGLVKAGNRFLLISQSKGVFYSDDNGVTWASLNDGNTLNVSETSTFSYNATTNELLVKNHNGVFLLTAASTTSNPTYTSVNNGLILNIGIRSISNNGTTWYLGTDNGVYASATGTIAWTTQNSGLSSLDVSIVVPYQTSLLVGVNQEGIYKSANTTINWVANNTGYNAQKTFSMATSGGQVIVAATEKGVFVSKNLATSYTASNTGLTDYLHVNDLTFKGSKLFAATENGGVFVSNDTGSVWTPFNAGITVMSIKKIVASANYVYLLDATGTIYQSNGTGIWTSIQGNLGAGLEDVAFTFYGNQVVIAIHGGGVHRRNETSGEWSDITGNLPTDHVTAIATLGTRLYVGSHHNGVFVSDISTINWTACASTATAINHTSLMSLNGMSIEAMASFGGYVFVSYRGGLLATSDHGQTWMQGGNQFNLPSFTAVNKIAFVTSRVFVTTENNCLYSNALSEVPLNVAIQFPKTPSCTNATDGQLTAEGTGGSAPYTYLWSNGATTASIYNLTPGTYKVTIKDALAAVHSDSMVVVGTVPVTPSIEISANATSICPNVLVTFSQTATNSGVNPTYKWFVNGVEKATTATYSSNTLANNDEVKCVLNSSETCVTSPTATSTVIKMTVSTSLTPSVTTTITAGTNPSCAGSPIKFTATTINGGTSAVYHWYVNGQLVAQNGPTFEVSTLSNNDLVTSQLISSLACATEDTVTAVAIKMTINPIPETPIITVNGTLLSSNAATGNQWNLNGAIIPNETQPTFQVNNNGNYSVYTTVNGCKSASSAVVAFTSLMLSEIATSGEKVVLFPNPNQGNFVINVEENTIQFVEIQNELGQVVARIDGGNALNVNVQETLKPGIYFVNILSSEGKAIRKITVQ